MKSEKMEKFVGFRMKEHDIKRLEFYAMEHNRTLSSAARDILIRYLDSFSKLEDNRRG